MRAAIFAWATRVLPTSSPACAARTCASSSSLTSSTSGCPASTRSPSATRTFAMMPRVPAAILEDMGEVTTPVVMEATVSVTGPRRAGATVTSIGFSAEKWR